MKPTRKILSLGISAATSLGNHSGIHCAAETKKAQEDLGFGGRLLNDDLLRLMLISPLNVERVTFASPWFSVPSNDCFPAIPVLEERDS